MASNNMYRIGDYVYFENSSSNPYLIRRIEELNKTSSGNVEAKVMSFFRRRDISNSLLLLADKHARDMEEDMDDSCTDLTETDRHQLNHKELYLSRQVETLPATHIRGKCSVTLLNETEDLKTYLTKQDTFFYSLVYDPAQKTLLADKGEIRVGSKYQAEVPDKMPENPESKPQCELEELIWDPESELTDSQIDQFLIVSRSVGTFARALDGYSSVRQPSLHLTAAAASRDITLFHSMQCLHNNNYDISKAIGDLVPKGGPHLCRDEMEDWSPSEANLFEEALEKYGKDFSDIKQDFLPWKTLPSIVEYYYMWKTSDRYVQQKRLKAAESESKLKQVYIPSYNKPNPNQIKMVNGEAGGKACEGCFCTSSSEWYTWGPPNMGCRLCSVCWSYWKKYGGLKMPPASRLERMQNHKIKGTDKELRYRPPTNMNMSPISGVRSARASHKTKQAFYLNATKLTRLARRLCKDILAIRHYSRRPFEPISIAAIKAECQVRLSSAPQISANFTPRQWPPLSAVLTKISTLQPKVKDKSGEIKKGMMCNNRKSGNVPLRVTSKSMVESKVTTTKRPHQNGNVESLKSASSLVGALNRITNGPQKKKRCLNSTDVSDDMMFVCNDKIRETRKELKPDILRGAARRPNKQVIVTPKTLAKLSALPRPVKNVNPEPIVIED